MIEDNQLAELFNDCGKIFYSKVSLNANGDSKGWG
jgi:hypothetical protein